MGAPSTGRRYGDKEQTPVPFPAYRCRAHAIDPRPHAPHSSLTHRCKVTADHGGDHVCICGKTWPPAVPVTALKGPTGA
jgi:hypothetical protein